eukprot:gnl/Dysnectes_brevis/2388_a2829_1000.p1 GENE.gnl/Dysnectes_brevis/2388_a2829_1000~~gnl/Dysnectes_brevis/2388_a2829_1000.p1  ORF type:complete len:151 (+),score=34.11 gnl/Dysnectes_brevis/2388_a2829_1000:852-1304(+)
MSLGEACFLGNLIDRPAPAMTIVTCSQAAAGLLSVLNLSINGMLVLGSVCMTPLVFYLLTGAGMWPACLTVGVGMGATIGGGVGSLTTPMQGGFLYLVMACGSGVEGLIPDLSDTWLGISQMGAIAGALLCIQRAKVDTGAKDKDQDQTQ